MEQNLQVPQDEELLDIKASLEDDDDESDSEKYKNSKKSSDPKSKTPVLDSFSRDLTQLAEENKLDPIIGRERNRKSFTNLSQKKEKQSNLDW
jgi:ATP-dependent Clp protease ATP-binding subunit ClpC